ncbi:MAG: hypothetical protein SFU87_16040 [Chitinophagaceae bacterium]|nr:hypothetical protein [Chitinophagaceae bacterium]
MGHIKEPDGVDFIIKGKPLTEKEKKAISEFIKADKERIAKQNARKTRVLPRKKPVA